MAALDLEQSPFSAVWLLVRDRLESCQALTDAGVDVEFEDDRDAIRGVGDFPADRVVVQVTGGMGPWSWSFADQHAGALLLNLVVVIRSLDFVDVANLQTALWFALYDDPDSAFQTSLCNAGAATGQPTLTRSLTKVGTEKNNGFSVYSGQMAFAINSPIFA